MKNLISRNYLMVLVLFFVSLLLSSCDDKNLAQALDGTWKTETFEAEEYGVEGDFDIMYSFVYNSRLKDKDGGYFVEWRHADISTDYEGLIISATITISLQGTWEILLGDLELTYDTSKLDVSVENLDYSLSENADYYTQMEFMQMYADGDVLALNNELKMMMRDEVYQESLNDLQEEDAVTFENVKIEDRTLTLENDEGETLTLVRITDDN